MSGLTFFSGCRSAPSTKKPSFTRALAFAWVWFFQAAILCAGVTSGKVVGVSDGDTVTVLLDGRGTKVRLYGIDCPEKKQDFGSRAKEFTSQAAFGKTVQVKIISTDRYGRLVAEIFLPDGRSLNQELVRSGYAWWYSHFAKNDTRLADLEKEARRAKRGLWADPGPVAPWDFRRQKVTQLRQ